MKRIFALMLALCLLLCGCKKIGNTPARDASAGKENQANQQTDSTENNGAQNNGDVNGGVNGGANGGSIGGANGGTDATQPSNPADVRYRHPLTGAPLSAPWSGQVTAVVVNNLKAAMPQSGISNADIFYEVEVEGDITRCLAIFSDLSGVGNIGAVRSARTYFNSLAVSYDAPLIHCGGSPGMALAGRYGASADVIEGWQHIDQGSYGQYFFRDMDRYSSGVAWEHCLFTSGEKLQQAIEAKGYYTPAEETYGLQFGDSVVLNGATANEVTVKFKSGKTTVFTYNQEKQGYTMYQHGQDHIDGNTGEVVVFQNVITIYTTQSYASDGVHKYYESIGTGKGYAAINGQIVPITWTRENLRDSYTYTLEDGTPLIMESGKTYIAMVGIRHDIAYK